MAQLPPCLVGMEACGEAHDFAKKFQKYGHTVRLMAPQFGGYQTILRAHLKWFILCVLPSGISQNRAVVFGSS